MLLYSCDHGTTLVDKVAEVWTDDIQIEELMLNDEEMCDTFSGLPWDFWD